MAKSAPNLNDQTTREIFLRKLVRGVDFDPLFEIWKSTTGGIADKLESGILSAIYEKCAESALKAGEVFLAEELARRGLATARKSGFENTRFYQIQALALARSGSTESASRILLRLTKAQKDPKSSGLLARTFRDLAWAESSPDARKRLFEEGFTYANDSFERNRSFYNGIQAAQFAFVADDHETARELIRKVREICGEESRTRHDRNSQIPFWITVTLAEAALILGEVELAMEKYRAMLALETKYPADTDATRRVAFKLIEHHADSREFEALAELLEPRPVLLFSGHQFDLETGGGRFNETDADRVSEAIASALETLRPQRAITSLSFGADLLFIEEALAKGIPLTVVLAYDTASALEAIRQSIPRLISSSSANADAKKWERRVDNVAEMMSPSRILEINFPPEVDGSGAYAYVNQLMIGMGKLKAEETGARVIPIIVYDGEAGKPGGTGHFLELLSNDIRNRGINLF